MKTLFATVLALAGVAGLQAQDFAISWWTIDAGAATVAGGDYELSGTIGQPDPGLARGDGYALDGGFWPGVQSSSLPTVPALAIQVAGDALVFSWPAGAAPTDLEATRRLDAAALWETVPAEPELIGDHYVLAVKPSGQQEYFRLRSERRTGR